MNFAAAKDKGKARQVESSSSESEDEQEAPAVYGEDKGASSDEDESKFFAKVKQEMVEEMEMLTKGEEGVCSALLPLRHHSAAKPW